MKTSLFFFAFALAPSLAFAQQAAPAGGHHHHAPVAAAAAASTKAFEAANAAMHRDMAIAFTGDADVDFLRGMIPHHQGAIDMAKVVLAHGKDPDVRKLAEDIVAAQQKEIAWMKAQLAKAGK